MIKWWQIVLIIMGFFLLLVILKRFLKKKRWIFKKEKTMGDKKQVSYLVEGSNKEFPNKQEAEDFAKNSK